jgi:hypothetical protein
MKKELLLLKGRVVANLELELQSALRKHASSGSGDGEAVTISYTEANQLIASLNTDSARLALTGSGSVPVKKAEELVPDDWLHRSLAAHEKARQEQTEKENIAAAKFCSVLGQCVGGSLKVGCEALRVCTVS